MANKFLAIPAKSRGPGVQAAIVGLDALMERAIAAAGCKDAKEFAKLPRDDQNDFLAQARGLAKNPSRDGVQDYDPETIERSPFNRDDFNLDALKELIEMVKKDGVLQNGIIRPAPKPHGKIKWQLIAGERRWLAAKAAKKLFPAAVRDVGDTEALEMQAVENLQREDLNAIDEATKYGQLVAAYEADGWTREQAVQRLQEKVGKGRSTIYERLSLLDLPATTRKATLQGRLPASHAGLLTKLKDPKTVEELTKRILKPESNQEDHGVCSFRVTKSFVDEAVQREKNLAEWQRMAEEFRQAGLVVLTPAECKAATPHNAHDWKTHLHVAGNYVGGNTSCDVVGASYRQYRQLWKKEPATVLSRTPDGTPVIIYERAPADLAVKSGGKLQRGGGSGSTSKSSEQERERARAHRRRGREFNEAMERLVIGIHSPRIDAFELQRQMTLAMVRQWRCEPLRRLATRRGWPKEGRLDEMIAKRLGGMTAEQLRGVMLEILLNHDAPSAYGDKWGESLKGLCDLCHVELPAWKDGKVQASG